MRHGDKRKKLNVTASHRRALLANLANALILHKRIETTLAKAKALRQYVEPLITKAKQEKNTTSVGSMHQRRTVFAYLQNKEAVKELFSIVSDKIANRNGGYTRVIKLGARSGDNAELAMIELVDFNETFVKSAKKVETKRTRRGKKKDDAGTTATDVTSATDVSYEKPSVSNSTDETNA